MAIVHYAGNRYYGYCGVVSPVTTTYEWDKVTCEDCLEIKREEMDIKIKEALIRNKERYK